MSQFEDVVEFDILPEVSVEEAPYTPPYTTPDDSMSKEAFIQRYVLTRATFVPHFHPVLCADTGAEAWDHIQEIVKS